MTRGRRASRGLHALRCGAVAAALLGAAACTQRDAEAGTSGGASAGNAGANAAGNAAGNTAGAATAASAAADSAVLYSARTTHSGVYTAEQATRGADVYAGRCVSCHMGMGNHTGDVFRSYWADYTLADMFDFMLTQMPKDNPGSLSSAEYVSVVAYLLQMNGWPAGRLELPTDRRALGLIRVDTSRAPAASPSPR